QVVQFAPETPVQPQEQAAPQSDAQTTDPQAAGSYHWVNPDIRNARTERTARNVPARTRMRIRITGKMSVEPQIRRTGQRQQPMNRITEAGDSR
ncbi:MAG: hypothetical protein V8T85_05445, partial [Blautia faecicola]